MKLLYELQIGIERLLKQDALSLRRQYWALGAILLICVLARLGPIHYPLIDRTLWKEIDYIEISKNYWHDGLHFLSPEISWPAAPPRITAMEFPLVPFLAANLYGVFGFHTLTVRLIPLLAYLVIAIYVFLLVRREAGPVLGLVSAMTAALMPIHHPFGRILFSEPLSIASSVGALYHFSNWVDSRKLRDGMFALLCFTLAVSLKLEPLFLLLPLTWLWYRKHGIRVREYAPFMGFTALALILPAIWYLYAFHLSRTSIDVFGVVPFIQGHDKLQTLTMIRSPHFFLAMGHRIWDLVWGATGMPFVLLGLIAAWRIKEMRLFYVYLATIAIYIVIVAEGQLDAPYRQLNAVPALSPFLAVGAISVSVFVLSHLKRTSNVTARGVAFASIILISLASSISYFRLIETNPGTPAHPLSWALAQEIRKDANPNDRVVMLGEYDVHVGGNDLSPVTYYYSGLRGWTLQPGDFSLDRVQELITQGATLFAVTREFNSVDLIHDAVARALVQKIKEKYQVLYENNGQMIVRLAR